MEAEADTLDAYVDDLLQGFVGTKANIAVPLGLVKQHIEVTITSMTLMDEKTHDVKLKINGFKVTDVQAKGQIKTHVALVPVAMEFILEFDLERFLNQHTEVKVHELKVTDGPEELRRVLETETLKGQMGSMIASQVDKQLDGIQTVVLKILERTGLLATVLVASSAGGALSLGLIGAIIGLVAGGAIGVIIGLLLAFFTFGFSIPIAGCIGSCIGFCLGALSGGFLGVLSGGTIGYCGYVKREAICDASACAWWYVCAFVARLRTLITASYRESVQRLTLLTDTFVSKLRTMTQAAFEITSGAYSATSHFVRNPRTQVVAGSAVCAAIMLGFVGAVVGAIIGALLGAMVGVVPALFTFGLSVPIFAVIGGCIGLCIGATIGSTIGLAAGGVCGTYAFGKRKQLRTIASDVWLKIGDCKSAVSAKAIQLHVSGTGTSRED